MDGINEKALRLVADRVVTFNQLASAAGVVPGRLALMLQGRQPAPVEVVARLTAIVADPKAKRVKPRPVEVDPDVPELGLSATVIRLQSAKQEPACCPTCGGAWPVGRAGRTRRATLPLPRQSTG